MNLGRVLPAMALGLLALAGCGAPEVVAGRAAPASTSPPVPVSAIQPSCEVRVPNLVGMTGDEASAALDATAALDIRFAVNFAPMTNKVISQSPTPGTCQQATEAIHLTLEAPPPTPHRELSARDWQLIAKSPDSHIGERITVYGYVFQFDSATGPDGFLAQVDGVRHRRSYEYDTNTAFSGSASMFENVVDGDMFRADVTVLGSYSYNTQIGGSTTVPRLQVDKIDVIG
ncbi:PASTA domain-containing protein [Pseudonocardia adelaidensis]